MKRSCPICAHHWAYALGDGRFKCRGCGHRYTFQSVWNACRLPDPVKRKLLDYFVLGVPAYRLRFKRTASQPATERFFRLIRSVLALAEDTQDTFAGQIEMDETMFGGKSKGKRGWGAAGKIIVLGILQRNGKVKVFPITGSSKLIGEISFRFNHRDQDLFPLSFELLRSTSTAEVKNV